MAVTEPDIAAEAAVAVGTAVAAHTTTTVTLMVVTAAVVLVTSIQHPLHQITLLGVS